MYKFNIIISLFPEIHQGMMIYRRLNYQNENINAYYPIIFIRYHIIVSFNAK